MEIGLANTLRNVEKMLSIRSVAAQRQILHRASSLSDLGAVTISLLTDGVFDLTFVTIVLLSDGAFDLGVVKMLICCPMGHSTSA